ncbi:MAG: DUF4185 domain-containing protein [Promethearchaeota archaeon]
MNRRHVGLIVLVLLLVTLGIGAFMVYFLPGWSVLPQEMVCQLTGEDALNDTTIVNVYGADIGLMVTFQDCLHFIFGDTFGPDKGDWRSNTMAYTTDPDPSDGITLSGWITDSATHLAKELIHSAKIDEIEMTAIPTTAVVVGDYLYVYFMSVISWGDGGSWTCNNASIAYSLDGHTFIEALNMSWPGNSHFIEWGIVKGGSGAPSTGGYLYFLTTGSGRFDSCYLVRVLETQILNQSSYQYFTGFSVTDIPLWSAYDSEAEPIIDAPTGEITVMWNTYLAKYILMNLDDVAKKIYVRIAQSPWGPWSTPFTILSRPEYLGFYAPNIDPNLVEDNGRIVYFTMSLWNEYNVYLMKVDFTRLLGFLYHKHNLVAVTPTTWVCAILIWASKTKPIWLISQKK